MSKGLFFISNCSYATLLYMKSYDCFVEFNLLLVKFRLFGKSMKFILIYSSVTVTIIVIVLRLWFEISGIKNKSHGYFLIIKYHGFVLPNREIVLFFNFTL